MNHLHVEWTRRSQMPRGRNRSKATRARRGAIEGSPVPHGRDATWTRRHVDDVPRGRDATWTMCHVDDVPRRGATWTMCHVDEMPRGRCAMWTMCQVDDVPRGRDATWTWVRAWLTATATSPSSGGAYSRIRSARDRTPTASPFSVNLA